MIPYDMESVRQLRATNSEVERFAALEFPRSGREWAAAEAARAERGRRRGLMSAVVAYFSPR